MLRWLTKPAYTPTMLMRPPLRTEVIISLSISAVSFSSCRVCCSQERHHSSQAAFSTTQHRLSMQQLSTQLVHGPKKAAAAGKANTVLGKAGTVLYARKQTGAASSAPSHCTNQQKPFL